MTALRTTRSVPPPLLAAAALLLTLLGCGGPPPQDDAGRPTMRPLPPPVAERIDYNPDTRTLKLYPLPPSSRWLVRTSPDVGAPEVQAGAAHVLPEDADPDFTYVSYRRPTGQASTPVSVSDIMAARATHASNIP
jgi:hypothetical protein